MIQIKSIAYDLEGTVINVEAAHHNGHIWAARDIGLPLSLDECLEKLPHFVGGPTDEVAKDISRLAKTYGINVNPNEVLERTNNHYKRLLKSSTIAPRQGFIDFFNFMRNGGIGYTIGSLTDEEEAELLLQKSGLLDMFGSDNIVLREHVKNVKPAPDVWIETARRANVNPSEQLIFEDSPRGILGAVKIGAYCIGMPVYNSHKVISDLISAGAKRIFMNWDEINPTALLKNINTELEKCI